jgi:metal-responsive CopG/Arc/MetJ family transcriptional regulator
MGDVMKAKAKRAVLTTVRIRPQIAKMLDQFASQGISKSDLINEALRQYLVEKEFQEIRSQMIPYAQAKGIYTDEDVEHLLK